MGKNKLFLLFINIILAFFMFAWASTSALMAVDCSQTSAWCVDDDGGVTENPIDTECTMEYAPVCGYKNGIYKTYSNKCILNANAAYYKYYWECKTSIPEPTPQVVIPQTCTSWYDGCNTCWVENWKVTVCTLKACFTKQEPKCLRYAPKDPTECTMEYSPICGYKNGKYKTYSNKCHLKADNAYYKYYWECKDVPTTICSSIYAPVCWYKDWKYKTYSSKCTLTADKAYYKYAWECKIDSIEPPVYCTSEYAPVCGYKNGKLKTYSNKCNLGKDKAYFKYSWKCKDVTPYLSEVLKRKAKNLINNFIKRLDSKWYSNEKKIAILEWIIKKLNILEEKKPKSSAIINYLIELLKEKISTYDDDFSDIENLFNID